MKFGKTLSNSVYGPWKDKYVDYDGLKSLLRETKSDKPGADDTWTEDDEARFAEELLNVQLEKVNGFQTEKYQDIKIRTAQCEAKLESLHLSDDAAEDGKVANLSTENEKVLRDILPELDAVSNEISQLERFSRINFSGFRKIVKKHDRRRGSGYRLKALLSARLASLPLNTEDYSPLLFRLSAMYSFIRRHLQDERVGQMPSLEPRADDEEYESMTFFVHPDDLVEVKTRILRHLPVLVYNPSTNAIVEAAQNDPSLTSIYFDNTAFSLYAGRIARQAGATSLRMRWFGALDDSPEVTLERKIVAEEEGSREQRLRLKRKYIVPFIKGEYGMEKTITRLRQRGEECSADADNFQAKVEDIQQFISSNKLQPMLRANYKRTAFQVPGDDSIRVSIDTDLRFTRETFEGQESSGSLQNFPAARPASPQSSEFPWAVLTIKLRDERKNRSSTWVRDLTSSHLLKEAPRFSKFVHGVAALYEDTVIELPFWMSLLDTDIRQDPQAAFEEEQSREEQRQEENLAIGSYGGTPRRKSSLHPFGLRPKDASGRASSTRVGYSISPSAGLISGGNDEPAQPSRERPMTNRSTWLSGFRDVLPALSSSKYGRSRRAAVELPPGVEEPKTWIKDEGPVKVEPKVWLANQRTFIKWQHVSVLLASLSLGLYNSAGRHNDIARGLAIAYTLIAVLIGFWGLGAYTVRSNIIRQRSGRELDSLFGPIVVCVSLGVALCFNLGFSLAE